jgi:hypothetical protein
MSPADNARCPRCGASFHCGANDTVPCVCNTLRLDAVALVDLRARYTGCLCLACLREIAASTTRHPEVDR